jgi:hypothetical protein
VAGLGREVEAVDAFELRDPREALRAERHLALEGVQDDPFEQVAEREVVVLRDGLQHLFELSVPPDEALPLFGPVREAEWSPTWKPTFVAPAGGSNTQEGAVFTTGPDARRSVWILLEYSAKRRSNRYAVVGPARATEIRGEVTPGTGRRSQVRVTERVTALGAEADEEVAHFAEHFPAQAEHWRTAIEASLQSRAR